ncbi:superinfection immunity protein [Rhodopseudomonas palustris]|nr:superinfection immunity protein [Rhodopseudomonas palustris]
MLFTGEEVESGIRSFALGALYFFAAAIYLLPTIVAFQRKVERVAAIGALNLLVGWTFLGWVAAFVWALAERPRCRKASNNGFGRPLSPRVTECGAALPLLKYRN